MDQASSLRDGASRTGRLSARKGMLCIAVASGKGGVGKTFFSVNLAAALAGMHRRVLLVDADLGLPNADILLGASPALTLEDCIFRGLALADAVATTPAGIDLLAAQSGSTEMVALGEARLGLLAEDLLRFASTYEVLLFDCSSGINTSVTAFLAASPRSIIIVQPDPTSLMDAYALIKVIHRDGFPGKVSLAMNGVRHRAGAERILTQLQAVVRDYLHQDLACLGMIPHTHRAAGAMQARLPLVCFDPGDPAAREVLSIARRIIAEQQTAVPSSKLNAAGLLRGLLSRKPETAPEPNAPASH